jgi:hypothetical protein
MFYIVHTTFLDLIDIDLFRDFTIVHMPSHNGMKRLIMNLRLLFFR